MKKQSVEKQITDSKDQATTFQALSWQQLLLKATGLSLVFAGILLLITIFILGIWAYFKLSEFLTASNLTFNQAKSIIEEGIHKSPPTYQGKTTVLVLGLDTVANKSNSPPLTDTMLLLSISYNDGKINLLSLPRDLWSEEYKTKINALYYYGKEKYPDQPERFPTEVVSEMTGVPINYTVVFSLDSITDIVDIIGGLEVEVPKSFTDTEFPREDVDIKNTTDSAQLYETVTFSQGREIMTADRVKKYIRSRHSEGDAGTDIDRAARQQLIIKSLVETVISRKVLSDPSMMAALYAWYNFSISPYIPVTDAIAIGYGLLPVRNEIVFQSNSVSIKTNESDGVIEHLPPEKTDNQWTYTIVDDTTFKETINTILF